MASNKREELEEALVKATDEDADPEEIWDLIGQIDGSDPGDSPTVEPAAQAQDEQGKENNMDSQFITDDMLGQEEEYSSAIKQLTKDEIKSFFFSSENKDITSLVYPGVTVLSPETRIHVTTKGEVNRVARGFGLFAAGGLGDDGYMTSPNGHIHYIDKDGTCYELVKEKQFNSFDATFSWITKPIECKGHQRATNEGTFESPKYKKVNGEYLRCFHQNCMMVSRGYWYTFSKKVHQLRAYAAMADRVGDAEARADAQRIFAEWDEARRIKEAGSEMLAAAARVKKDELGLADDAYLPGDPALLKAELPDGTTVGDAITSLGGQRFVLTLEIMASLGPVKRKYVAFTKDEIVAKAAAAVAAYQKAGQPIRPLSVELG